MIAKQHHIKTGNRAPRLRAGMLSLLCVLFGMLLTGCIKGNYEPEPAVMRTMLLYMGGDNNLSGEVTAKIEQIKAAPLSKDCRVVIYTDVTGENPQLLELVTEKGTITTKVLREYKESNSASADVFGEVLKEVRALYPASTYGLVLFSHASGWLPEGTYYNLRTHSVVIDGTSGMEIPAFAAAISDGMLDYIVFEACYMASVEVAYELKDKARYIIASKSTSFDYFVKTSDKTIASTGSGAASIQAYS